MVAVRRFECEVLLWRRDGVDAAGKGAIKQSGSNEVCPEARGLAALGWYVSPLLLFR
jgi:hypothetical protein